MRRSRQVYCPVCKADPFRLCNGKELRPGPACSCEQKCTAEAVKEDCPVAKRTLPAALARAGTSLACSCTVKVQGRSYQRGLSGLQGGLIRLQTARNGTRADLLL